MITVYHHGWRNETTEWFEGVDYVHAITGKCHGLLFAKRGTNDNHVCIHDLVHDDELWHTPPSGGTSSYWVSDILDVWTRAESWLKENCDPDPDGYGYVFRS